MTAAPHASGDREVLSTTVLIRTPPPPVLRPGRASSRPPEWVRADRRPSAGRPRSGTCPDRYASRRGRPGRVACRSIPGRGPGGQLGRGAREADAAAGHDDHTVAEHGHVLRLMGGQQHRAARARVGDQLPEPHALLRIQADGGFVEQQHARVADERGGEGDPLAHTAGEPLDALAPHIGEIYGLEHAPHLAVTCAPVGELLEDRDVVDECEGREFRVEARVLGR